jgi:hypothetical protein
MGKNFMYTLAEVGPPPATLRVYGAGNCILPLHGVGYLTLSFNSANFAKFDIAEFQRASVQGVHVAAHRFHVHMFSAVEGGDIRGRASRKGRGGGKGCAGRLQAATVPKRANPLVSVSDAAVRLGIFDPEGYEAFQRTSQGLLEPSTIAKPTCVHDVLYSAHVSAASDEPPFHVRTLPGNRSPPGARASLDLIGPLEPSFNDGVTYMAVVVDRDTDFVWVHPLRDLHERSFKQLLEVHAALRASKVAWGTLMEPLLDLDVSQDLYFPLPRVLAYEGIGDNGRSGSRRATVRLDPSRGLLLSPAECASRLVAFRAAHYMARAGLSPVMLRSMLLAGSHALNYCPRTLPHAAASSHQALHLEQPDVSDFKTAPGTLVTYNIAHGSKESERGLGLFICPAPGGLLVHDLELDSPMLVAQLQSDVPMFTRSVVAGSPLVQRLFWPLDDLTRWVERFLGVPRRMGSGLGLASTAWLGGRGLHYLPNGGAPGGPTSASSMLPTPDWESESDSVIVGVNAEAPAVSARRMPTATVVPSVTPARVLHAFASSFCPRHGRSCPCPPASSDAARAAYTSTPVYRDDDPDVLSAPAVN